MPLPRAPIDLARRGAWSAETTHAPRVPDVAVAANRRAHPISKAFSRGVTSARAEADFRSAVPFSRSVICAYSSRPLSPCPYNAAAPKGPAFWFLKLNGLGCGVSCSGQATCHVIPKCASSSTAVFGHRLWECAALLLIWSSFSRSAHCESERCAGEATPCAEAPRKWGKPRGNADVCGAKIRWSGN